MSKASLHRQRVMRGIVLLPAMWLLAGCEVDSYFDPSKTGRFEFTPTTIPILERIDVIEREPDPWARATQVTAEDLLPSDLTYRITPGDQVRVDVFELLVQGQIWTSAQRIDAAGMYRLPAPVGDVRASGLTAQEFQNELTRIMEERVMAHPVVNVLIEEGAGFTYTVYGAVRAEGLYSLRRPDFRLMDALAQSAVVITGIDRVYIVRHVPLGEEPSPPRGGAEAWPSPEAAPPDIEELIRRLGEPQPPQPPEPSEAPAPAPKAAPQEPPKSPSEEQPQPPVDIEDLLKELDKPKQKPSAGVAPGTLPQQGGPPIDLNELEPLRVPKPQPPSSPTPAPKAEAPPAQPPVLPPPPPSRRETYVYDQQRDEWTARPQSASAGQLASESPHPRQGLERIIEIPFERLKQGDGSVNAVIRPNDTIYVREPQSGVVYVDGEILRPGVYNFPDNGKMTLSRLVAAAGGPGPLAIPTRVDLTRIVNENREATIRLNLAAIRQRTEPDLYLRPDDHIIIGTSWIATPLAVFRNGFRFTYGFGFLLDRNFGNDVFGPPPESFGAG